MKKSDYIFQVAHDFGVSRTCIAVNLRVLPYEVEM